MALLREVRDLMSAQLEKSGIELTVENSTDAIINGDSNQLKQVLLNLIRNGADSVGAEGKIVLRVHTERVSLGGRSCHAAILEVEDNGKGISSDVQKRLFDPFYTHQARWHRPWLIDCGTDCRTARRACVTKPNMGRGTTFGIDHADHVNPMKNKTLLIQDDRSLGGVLDPACALAEYDVTVAASAEVGLECTVKPALPLL